MFKGKEVYHRRRDIHEKFGGQQQGGISTPSIAPFIFLFTGEAGEQHGYFDGYDETGLFIYTGEGQTGDMRFVRGNRAIRDHVQNGKELLLFSATKRSGFYRFEGVHIYAGYDDQKSGPDTNGQQRKLIRFQLAPLSNRTASDAEEVDIDVPDNLSFDSLRALAYAVIENTSPTVPIISKKNLYRRSAIVKAYVLARANGVCESCRKVAPFFNKDGGSYLEAHHIRRLSDDGLDSPAWVAAICPNCHREIHHGRDGKAKNNLLGQYVVEVEKPNKQKDWN